MFIKYSNWLIGNYLEPNITLYCGQDVNDVLAAIDHVIDMGLADPSKIAVMGGSHGGFLTTHLIGQVQFSRRILVVVTV